MRIENVKINSKGVEIHYSTDKGDARDIYSLVTKDEPTKQFRASLQELQPAVVEILGLNKEYQSGMVVLGVALHFDKDGNRGAVITCKKYLENKKVSFIFNTPYLPETPLVALSVQCLPKGTPDLLDTIVDDAENFLGGERLQMDAFEDDHAEEPKSPPAVTASKKSAIPAKESKKPAGRARNSKLADPKLKLHVKKK